MKCGFYDFFDIIIILMSSQSHNTHFVVHECRKYHNILITLDFFYTQTNILTSQTNYLGLFFIVMNSLWNTIKT